MTPPELLPDAVDALEALAAGLLPDRVQALAGAFALDSLSLETEAGLSSREVSELADAARGLYHIAAGGTLSDRCSRPTRIAELARAVRKLIESKPLTPTWRRNRRRARFYFCTGK
jgi:hypothetical protein